MWAFNKVLSDLLLIIIDLISLYIYEDTLVHEKKCQQQSASNTDIDKHARFCWPGKKYIARIQSQERMCKYQAGTIQLGYSITTQGVHLRKMNEDNIETR